jgi:hypothetical protein
VEQEATGYKVHDGGHLQGLLFGAGPSGGSRRDKRAIYSLVNDANLKFDNDSGVVFAHCEDPALVYWMMEIGRTIGVAAALIPTSIPLRRRRRLGQSITRQIIKRLMNEGLMSVVRPGLSVRGVTEQERHVDLSYTIPENPLQMRPDTTVHVLTMDLDVIDPIAKAHRGLATATDLAGTAMEYHDIDVRVVHSIGAANGNAERAARLIKVAAAKQLLRDYSWDDPEEQSSFMSTVGQELAPLVAT